MLDRAISRPTSSCTSLDGDECPFSPFSKREYLLAQMRQKYDLIDYLLEQARLSHILLTKYMRILLIISSRLSLPRFIVRTSPHLSRSRNTAKQHLLPANTDKT